MVTDERIAKFIDTCRAMGDAGDGARYDWWDGLAAALTELQSLRSKPVVGVEGQSRRDMLTGMLFTSFDLTSYGIRLQDVEKVADDIFSALLPEATAPVVSEPVAWRDVAAERQRQKDVEGWTPEHDDEHIDGSLALAAGAYAIASASATKPFYWPWDERWWKPTNRRRNLVKAGALILAEIERLDRTALKEDHHD